MITIFQGRKISLDGTEDQVYANVAVAMRDVLHEFNTGKNLNPFAVFMKIALHADKNGWSFSGRTSIKKGTGLSSDAAIASALKHLCKMRIDGHRVMSWYRSQDPKTGQWWWSLYRIFPDAWSDGLETVPEKFEGKKLHLHSQEPPPHNLGVDNPQVDNPTVEDLCRKDNQSVEGTPQGKEKESPPKNDEPEKEEPDILDGIFHYATREPPENWADTAAAGGADDWTPAVDAFAGLVGLDPSTVPKGTRREWSRVLQEVGRVWQAGPVLLTEVISQVPKSELDWKTYTSPHQAKDDLGVLIGQHRNNGIRPSKKGNGGTQASAIAGIAAFKDKLRERPVEAEYTVMGEAL